jgi:hypothetical protein
MARRYVDERKRTFPRWVEQIDEAIAQVDRERRNYQWAMDHAARGEPVVWHSSQIGAIGISVVRVAP